MSDRNKILDDSSLKLSVAMDETAKQTQDLGAAFELNTDSAFDLSVQQEKLGQSMVKASKARTKQTKQVDKSTDLSKEEEKVQKEHTEALKKRTEVEEKLAKQQPLIKYDQPGTNTTSGPTPQDEPLKELPEVVKSLKTLVKEELGKRQEFIKDYKDEKEKEHKQRMTRLKNFGKIFTPFENMKNSKTSGTAKVVGGALNAGTKLVGNTVDSLLGQIIPGYGMVKSGIGSVVKSYTDASKGRREQRWEKRADKDYQSRFKRLKEDHESGTVKKGDYKSQILPSVIKQNAKTAKEEKAKLKENQKTDRDREESNKDRKGILDILGGIKKAMMFKAMFGLIAGVLGAMGGALTGGIGILTGALTGLGSILGGMATTIISGVTKSIGSILDSIKSALGMKSAAKSIPTSGGQPTPDPVDPKDPKKGPKTDPKKGPKPKSGGKGLMSKGIDAVKGAGSSLWEGAKQLGGKFSKVGTKAATQVAKRVGTTAAGGMIGGPAGAAVAGAAGLAWGAYDLYGMAKDGDLGDTAKGMADALSDGIDTIGEKAAGFFDDAKSWLSDMMPGTAPTITETKELDQQNLTFDQRAEKAQREMQELQLRIQRLQSGGNNVVQTSNNVTNVHAGGYGGFQPDYGPQREGAMIR